MSGEASFWLALASGVGLAGGYLAFYREYPAIVEACLRRANRAAVGYLLLGITPYVLHRLRLPHIGLFELFFGVLPWWGCVGFLVAEVWLVRITKADASGLTLRGWRGRRHVPWETIEHAALDDSKPRLILWSRDSKENFVVSVAPALVDTVCQELRTRLPRGNLSHELWDPNVDVWAPGSAGWVPKDVD